jgi:uncharacterized membrane protein YeaQ/YmgE (transglycosylase-associated protein family)
MTAKSLLINAVVGILASWLTGKIMKGKDFGFIGDVVVGVVGGFLGQWVFSVLDLATYGILGSLLIAVVGRVLVVSLIRKVRSV